MGGGLCVTIIVVGKRIGDTSSTSLIAFHFVLMPLRKAEKRLFLFIL